MRMITQNERDYPKGTKVYVPTLYTDSNGEEYYEIEDREVLHHLYYQSGANVIIDGCSDGSETVGSKDVYSTYKEGELAVSEMILEQITFHSNAANKASRQVKQLLNRGGVELIHKHFSE